MKVCDYKGSHLKIIKRMQIIANDTLQGKGRRGGRGGKCSRQQEVIEIKADKKNTCTQTTNS